MSRSSRALCTLYTVTALWLAWVTVMEFQYGPLWATLSFAAASIIPMIGLVRETVIADERRENAGLREHMARRTAEAKPPVPAGMEDACCERWWTSLGTDHDDTCEHQNPRSSAA